MKNSVTVVCHHEYGRPDEVVRVERWNLPDIKPNEALVLMKAAPLNPADLNLLEGTYAIRPPLPAVPGNEGVGVVAQAGIAVADLRSGQLVIRPGFTGTWCEAYAADARELIAVPPGIDLEQAALMTINLPTAWRLLEDFLPLKRGDWVIQNAANSAVGRFIIQLGRLRGIQTVNVVRRPELADELKALGATVVLAADALQPAAVEAATGGAPVLLGFNAVGGAAVGALARCLAPGGTLVTYGAMARAPLQIGNGALIFRDLRFRGFWISGWYRQASQRDRHQMFSQLAPLVRSGGLRVPVEKSYPLEEARAAVVHAQREGRSGKILFTMN
jgi:trans-2-enoyl-CoA reductase